MLKGDPRLRSRPIYERMSSEFPAGDILRETALDQIPKSARRALRAFLKEFFGCFAVVDGALSVEKFAGSISKAAMLAVVQDLRHLAAYLSLVAFETLDDASEDQRIGRVADGLAVHLESVAEIIDSGIRGRR